MIPSRLIVFILTLATSVMAQTITFTMSETAGFRRFGYPVTASVESAAGMLRDTVKACLIAADGKEVPAQFTAMSRWRRLVLRTVIKCS